MMNHKFLEQWGNFSPLAIALAVGLLSHPALAIEETLSLCETGSTAVRIYVEDGETRMRVFDRQDNVIWMNKTPASEDVTSEGFQYTNRMGEQTVTLSVNPTANNCQIQVGDRPIEAGTLLIQNARPGSEMASVTGTVSYLQRIALPPGAIVEAKLVDVSRADAPAIVLSEQTIVTQGEQVPIPFTLPYDPADIDPRYRYAVQARITIDGELAWISTTSYPVITQGNSTKVEVIVEPVGDRSSR